MARYTVLIVGLIAVLGRVGIETASFAAILAAAGFAIGMQQMIDAVVAAGKQVYLANVPPIPGASTEQDTRIREYNLVIDELMLDPANVASGLVRNGPDFYTYFSSNPDEMCTPPPPPGERCYHPTGVGYASMGRLWSESLIGVLK